MVSHSTNINRTNASNLSSCIEKTMT